MAHENSHIVFKHDSNTIISVYSDLLENKIGEFLYNPKLSINLIQKEELASFDNINHFNIYIIYNAKHFLENTILQKNKIITIIKKKNIYISQLISSRTNFSRKPSRTPLD